MRLTPKRVLLLAIVGLFVLFGLLGLSVFGPSPPIVVSPQTTYLTEPLDQWGRIDYVEALRRRLSEGVTPENNAAVLVWQALGPAEIPPQRRSAFFSELGIAPLPAEGDYFADIYNHSERENERVIEWMRAHQQSEVVGAEDGLPPDPEMDSAQQEFLSTRTNDYVLNEFFQLAQRTLQLPWRGSEIPPLAEWLQRNQAALELTVQASMRPKYYSPIQVNNGRTAHGARLFTMLLQDIQHARSLGRALCHRAMLHVGEGRTREAWRDLAAVHRLARLIGRQGALVQQLVAVALDDMALRAGAAVLHEGQLSSDELREIRQFLMQLSPPCNVRRSIGTFERFMILDILANGARGAVEVLGPEVSGVLLATRIDWNIPLRLANDWFDKITAATDPTTVFEREAALTQVEEELKALMANSRTPRKIAGALVSSTKRSELAGEIMLSMLLPAIRSVQQAEDRATAKLRLLQVASALAIHRAQSGEYPAALEDLAVDLRGELPTDPYSGNAFLYEKRGEGYVLWSLGGNLADDKASGKQFHITVGGEAAADDAVQDHQDDIVLRAPWAE